MTIASKTGEGLTWEEKAKVIIADTALGICLRGSVGMAPGSLRIPLRAEPYDQG